MTISYDTLVEKYRAVRDRKNEIAERHKAELAPINEAMSAIESRLLSMFTEAGLSSVKTAHGTAYTSTSIKYTVEDPAALREFVESNNMPELLETRISKSAVDQYLEAGGSLPPGVKVSQHLSVNIRK